MRKAAAMIFIIFLIIMLFNSIAESMSCTYPEKVVTETKLVNVEYQKFEINNYDEMIEYWCNIYEIDASLAKAISRLETGHYKSELFIKCNNFGGMTGSKGYMSFPGKMEGCEAFVSMLKYGYIDKGLDTPEKMNPVYCPPNKDWAALVRKLMGEE